jgi:hypothetical protein
MFGIVLKNKKGDMRMFMMTIAQVVTKANVPKEHCLLKQLAKAESFVLIAMELIENAEVYYEAATY